MRPKTCVSFKNYDFSTEDSEETPRGLDAALFIAEELADRGLSAEYGDGLDFYAHIVDCRVDHRRLSLTIGFVGDDELVVFLHSAVPRFLRFIGISAEAEVLKLARALHDVITKHGFECVRWWTMQEWSGAREQWSTSPEEGR